MHITERRTKIVVDWLRKHLNAEWCAAYGEPGYHATDAGILFANWNAVNPDRPHGRPVKYNIRRSAFVEDYLKEAGFECEWSDEWHIDYDNGKAWRTSPDSYGWECQLALGDGFILTPDDDISDWIDEFRDDPSRMLPSRITQSELEELGWKRVDERFETGHHFGQNDTPPAVFKRLIARDDVRHVLFRRDDVGQFDVKWEAYVIGDEE